MFFDFFAQKLGVHRRRQRHERRAEASGERAYGVGNDDGIFNIEGGCYAKCIDLSKEHEPEIYGAIKFGALVENVVVDPLPSSAIFAEQCMPNTPFCGSR